MYWIKPFKSVKDLVLACAPMVDVEKSTDSEDIRRRSRGWSGIHRSKAKRVFRATTIDAVGNKIALGPWRGQAAQAWGDAHVVLRAETRKQNYYPDYHDTSNLGFALSQLYITIKYGFRDYGEKCTDTSRGFPEIAEMIKPLWSETNREEYYTELQMANNHTALRGSDFEQCMLELDEAFKAVLITIHRARPDLATNENINLILRCKKLAVDAFRK